MVSAKKREGPPLRAPLGRTYLREWRRFRGLTQEQLSARMLALAPEEEQLGASTAGISRKENGSEPYSQRFLEVAARALRCTPADLLQLDPSQAPEEAEVLELLRQLPLDRRRHALRLIKTLFEEEPAA